MTKNITLRLDESILRKARHAAVEEDTSLSQWVTNIIVKEVSEKNRYILARDKALQRLEKPFRLGGKPVSREEIHER